MVRHKKNALHIMTVLLATEIVVLALIGYALWKPTDESTRIAAMLFLTASVWISGPFLIWMINKKYCLMKSMILIWKSDILIIKWNYIKNVLRPILQNIIKK